MIAVRKVVGFCGVFGLVNVLRCVWMMRIKRADLLALYISTIVRIFPSSSRDSRLFHVTPRIPIIGFGNSH